MSSPDFAHQPVLVEKVAELFGRVPPGTVIDATVGGGGHARAILEANPSVSILGFDLDADAVRAASAALAAFGERAHVIRSRFDAMTSYVRGEGVGDQAAAGGRIPGVSGVLFDLGVSSYQLDTPQRGFSFSREGPLDMRMDQSSPLTAADVVNSMDPAQMAALIAANGEGTFAMRIARAIADARPLTTTRQLSEVIREAIPARARRTGRHPAARVFQAIRIAVNAELDVLRSGLGQALELVVPHGRVVVIAYHSGEDRIVKRAFADAVSGGCVCPSGLPCVCGAVPRAAFVSGSGTIRPSEEEISRNPRAASARLRVVEILRRAGDPDGS